MSADAFSEPGGDPVERPLTPTSSPPRRRRPGGVWFVFVVAVLGGVTNCLTAMTAIPGQIYPASLVAGVCSFLVAAGLLRGHPLARQASIAFALFMTISGAANTCLGSTAPVGVVLLILGVLTIVALRTDAALRFFGFHCPRCGSMRARAASFLYNRLRCADCATEWRRGDEVVDTTAFD